MAFDFSRSQIGLMPPMARALEDPLAASDSTFGISPGMRAGMQNQEAGWRGAAGALLQNPLFSSDPESASVLANAYAMGAPFTGAQIITPNIGRRLDAMDRVRNLQERGLEAGVTRGEAETAGRRGVLGGRALTPDVAATLGITQEHPERMALGKYLRGQAGPMEKEFVENFVLPQMAARVRALDAFAAERAAHGESYGRTLTPAERLRESERLRRERGELGAAHKDTDNLLRELVKAAVEAMEDPVIPGLPSGMEKFTAVAAMLLARYGEAAASDPRVGVLLRQTQGALGLRGPRGPVTTPPGATPTIPTVRTQDYLPFFRDLRGGR